MNFVLDEFTDPPFKINILYEDEHLVAIHKPAGLLVHRSYLARKEKYFALQMTRDMVGCHVFPVHRLDRPTSGVLLMGKTSEIANQLCQQIAAHLVDKHYFALVRGHMHDKGELDYPLRLELDKVADKFASQDKEAQAAVTRYAPILNAELPVSCGRYPTSRFALIDLQPITGRKHQLRRHMAHLRHPILGDTTHGDGKQNQLFRTQFELRRLWLMAYKLTFTHPITGKYMQIQTQMEPEWGAVFAGLGWGNDDLVKLKPYMAAMDVQG